MVKLAEPRRQVVPPPSHVNIHTRRVTNRTLSNVHVYDWATEPKDETE